MYMLNMVIILIVMYCNVVTAIDKIPTYLLHFNRSQQEDCFDGLFLHSAHYVLMSLGLWEGGIITFILTILGRFPSSDIIILSTDKTFWDLCPHSHVLCCDVVDCGLPMHSTVHLKR